MTGQADIAGVEGGATDRPARKNVKLVIAYNGAAYHGWQRQADGLATVQQNVEDLAARVMGHPVTIFGAGRTDAGVHAEGQVANFYTTNFSIPLMGVRRAMNSRLPGDIAIRSAVEVPEGFQASRSAVGKTYRYRIYTPPTRPVELYKQGGIRGCEIGTAMFGLRPDGKEEPAHMDLVRLAIPRRMYTQAHMDYVVEVVTEVFERRDDMRGMKFIRQPPALRHFTGRFGYVDA